MRVHKHPISQGISYEFIFMAYQCICKENKQNTQYKKLCYCYGNVQIILSGIVAKNTYYVRE
jgi:hypothetical protein